MHSCVHQKHHCPLGHLRHDCVAEQAEPGRVLVALVAEPRIRPDARLLMRMLHVYLYAVRVDVQVYVHVLYLCVCRCACVYVYVNAHVHVSMHICACVCLCVYACL